MKIGLLLEGGGMRGMYTTGVLDVMMDYQIPVDDIVGVSAGALFGINYISKQRGRALRYNKQYMRDKRYRSLKSWITTGNFFNKEFAYYTMPMTIDIFDNETYKNSHSNLFAVVTNVETGEAEYIKIADAFKQMEILRATSALPYVSRIVEVAGKKYLDGGIADSIPIQYMQSQTYDKIIVVLTQHQFYRKQKSKGSQLNRLFYRKYPNLVEQLDNRYLNYNQSVELVNQLEQAGEIFVIRPTESINIKRLENNPDELERVYQLGIKDMQNHIKALKDYLER